MALTAATMQLTLLARLGDNGDVHELATVDMPVRVTTLGDESTSHVSELEKRTQRAVRAFAAVMASED